MKKSVLALLLASALLTGCGFDDNNKGAFNGNKGDLIIGLGLQVNYVSCNSRLLLERRVDRAYEVSLTKANPYFAFAGKGNPNSLKSCFDENGNGLTEAQAMKDYLMAKYKVSAERIILEEQSISTDQNAQFLMPILAEFEAKTGINFNIQDMSLVTSAYHNHRQSWKDESDNSSVFYFNRDFGANTFVDGKNVYSSSELSNEVVIDNAISMAFLNDKGESLKALGDINNDGKAEMVSVNTKRGEVLSVGFDGATFRSLIPASSVIIDSLLVIDINQDGYDELLIKEVSGKTLIYLNLKNNTFEQTPLQVNIPSNSLLSDIDSDQILEVITFNVDGVYVADTINAGTSKRVLDQYGTESKTDLNLDYVYGDINGNYPRYLADITGDGFDDIVAFGHKAIYASVNDGKGNFLPKEIWLEDDAEGNGINFTAGAEFAELIIGEGWAKGSGWTADKYLRGMADVDGDGRADIWAIGEHGVYVSWSTDINKDGIGDGFENLNSVWIYESKFRHNKENDSAYQQFTPYRGWDLKKHPRFFGDVNGDGRADLVGFGEEAVYVSLSENP